MHIDTVGEVDPAFAVSLAMLEHDEKDDKDVVYDEDDFEKTRFAPLRDDEEYGKY